VTGVPSPRLRGEGARGLRALLATIAALLFAFAAHADPAPNFWDPALHLERPDLSGLRAIRFLTADDYPPLNFVRGYGDLAGFNVEIARGVCEELHMPCTVQARRFDTLVDALQTGKGDAVAASIASTPALRETLDFSAPYYKTPARFVTRKTSQLGDATPQTLAGRNVGVVSGSAHEAYLRTFFPAVRPTTFPSVVELLKALTSGAVEAAFGDGLTFAVWLAGEQSFDCCVFKGGPYSESRFFGEGVGIAVRKEDAPLRQAIDWALARMAQRGLYAEIYRKYFPVGFY